MSDRFLPSVLAELIQRLKQASTKEELPVGMTEVPDEAELVPKGKEDTTRVQQILHELIRLVPFAKAVMGTESAFDSLINAMPDLVFQKDTMGRYVNCNQAFADYVGRTREEVPGCLPTELFPARASEVLILDDQTVLRTGETLRSERWASDSHGRRALFDTVKTPYYNKDGELVGLVGVSRDITKRYLMEQELRRLATTDALTGVLNRGSLLQKLRDEILRARRYKRALSVLLIDIDHFKSINDSHGHDVGDVALRQMASLCQESLRSSDIFGRYGGEEFLVILPESNLAHAMQIAERLRIRQETYFFKHKELQLHVTLSVGVSNVHLADLTDTLEALLKRADVALYEAKKRGRNQCVSELEMAAGSTS